MKTILVYWLVLWVASVTATACVKKSTGVRPTPVSKADIGQCAEPDNSGMLSAKPKLRRADRDLDGDGTHEWVVADRNLCTDRGNCYWNIFVRDEGASCYRYGGTVAAHSIDRLARRGEDGFFDLRGWWRLSSGDRQLVQEYRFRKDGYQVAEVLVCRRMDDDRIVCAPDNH